MISVDKIKEKVASIPIAKPAVVAKKRIDTARLFRYDKKRFLENYSSHLSRATKDHLDARLMFHAHALEKGLSHSDFRYGFGRRALSELANTMAAYCDRGFDKSDSSYKNALSVIKEYVRLHEEAHYDITYLSKTFGILMAEIKACDATTGGAMTIRRDSKTDNRMKNFKDLFINRYSVREFSKRRVAIKDIEEAVSIATKSPSVCNRQPSRVYVVTQSETIAALLKIQGGFSGYELPPALILITADISNFIQETERNQAYIDGGAFSASLLLSFEYVGLAACPLNAMFNLGQEKAIRSLISVPHRESLIMFIAIGHFKDMSKVPKSYRYPVSGIVREI